MHTFFIENISDELIELDENESKHAIRVMRLSVGKPVRVVNGLGTEYLGEIVDDHPKKTVIGINESSTASPPPYKVGIALAPTKSNDRTELFLEKATEIGLTDFFPIVASNSERQRFNPERWKKITISALKQSGRLWLPRIHDVIDLPNFVDRCDFKQKLIAHCEPLEKQELKKLDTDIDSVILIGPEGDFTTDEIELAIASGFDPVSLGVNRLRTETAGIVATTLLRN